MGALLLEAGSSFIAGLLSFLSPCVLPLLPSYLGFLAGSAGLAAGSANTIARNAKSDAVNAKPSTDDAPAEGESAAREAGRRRRSLLLNVLGFCAGFALVFIALGLAFSSASFLFSGARRTIAIISGALIALFGLNAIFDFISFLNFEKRFDLRRPAGAAGAILTGAAFGAGWSPCVGPMLASILFLASAKADLPRAALLLGAYSAGLALPFIASGLAFNAVKPLWSFLKRHAGAIRVASGILLIAMGISVALGASDWLVRATARTGIALSAFAVREPEAARRAFITAWIALAAAFTVPAVLLAARDARAGGAPRYGALAALSGPALAFAALALLEGTGVLKGAALLGSWLANGGR